MPRRVYYEWDVETCARLPSGEVDILDHNHADTAAQALLFMRAPRLEEGCEVYDRLVLVRNVCDAQGWPEEKSWAYVVDGLLPSRFWEDDCLPVVVEGAAVPASFHKELARLRDRIPHNRSPAA